MVPTPLHSTFKLTIGAHVMLTTNVEVSDGLVNGARCKVLHIVTNNTNYVTSILVKFYNCRVGPKAVQTSPYRARFANAVPLRKLGGVLICVPSQLNPTNVCRFATGIEAVSATVELPNSNSSCIQITQCTNSNTYHFADSTVEACDTMYCTLCDRYLVILTRISYISETLLL